MRTHAPFFNRPPPNPSPLSARSLSNSVAGRQLLSRLAAATSELFAPTVATAARILAESSQPPLTPLPPAAPERVQLLVLSQPPHQQHQQQHQHQHQHEQHADWQQEQWVLSPQPLLAAAATAPGGCPCPIAGSPPDWAARGATSCVDSDGDSNGRAPGPGFEADALLDLGAIPEAAAGRWSPAGCREQSGGDAHWQSDAWSCCPAELLAAAPEPVSGASTRGVAPLEQLDIMIEQDADQLCWEGE